MYNKFSQKLSFKEAVTIRQETLSTTHTTDKLPILSHLILQKIMMCDQRCRSCLFQESSSSTQSDPTDTNIEIKDSDSDNEDNSTIHPVDCMLAILHCCDDILLQEFIS